MMLDQSKFNEWQTLRSALKVAKKEKNLAKIIDICDEIIALDQQAPFIQIMTPLFHKEKGTACLKLGYESEALNSFELSKAGFVDYRKNNQLSTSDDWLKDIAALEKKIAKLSK
ncbi:hypothetical protein [Vibrio vulnificus]|uniref:hypothetical protein n=1 Tax=Vibrio vulnificus TaxID=672 RepID=UPI001CDCF1E5|nr:hypothetical protein [Vibrio vulnificus]MCA3928937.1 hypothetical protein [Vibrio vulnificus]